MALIETQHFDGDSRHGGISRLWSLTRPILPTSDIWHADIITDRVGNPMRMSVSSETQMTTGVGLRCIKVCIEKTDPPSFAKLFASRSTPESTAVIIQPRPAKNLIEYMDGKEVFTIASDVDAVVEEPAAKYAFEDTGHNIAAILRALPLEKINKGSVDALSERLQDIGLMTVDGEQAKPTDPALVAE